MVAYGYAFGLNGILGVSLPATMVAFIHSNGGLSLALATQ